MKQLLLVLLRSCLSSSAFVVTLSPRQTSLTCVDQAIEKYTALTRHKRELLRKNQKIQTRIAQHLRKHKTELVSRYPVLYCTVLYCTVVSSSGRAMTDEEEKAEYARLLQELADLMENTERETAEFEQEMAEVQVGLNTILLVHHKTESRHASDV